MTSPLGMYCTLDTWKCISLVPFPSSLWDANFLFSHKRWQNVVSYKWTLLRDRSFRNVNCVLVKYHVGFTEKIIIVPSRTTKWVLTSKSWIVPHARSGGSLGGRPSNKLVRRTSPPPWSARLGSRLWVRPWSTWQVWCWKDICLKKLVLQVNYIKQIASDIA